MWKMSKKLRIRIVPVVLIMLLFLSSCAALTRIGYGVVLWGGTSLSIKPGTIVEIYK